LYVTAIRYDTSRTACRRRRAEFQDVVVVGGTAAVVVRPDRHVLGTADTGTDLQQLIEHLPTRATATPQPA
jgi:hypothetical protein